MNRYLYGTYRNQLINRRSPRGGARQVYQVQNQLCALAVEMDVNEPRTFDRYRDAPGCGPAKKVAEQVAMIGKVFPGIAAINIGL